MSDKDKKKNNVKRNTEIVIISVLVLVILTLSTSYSAFFSVESQSNIQELTAGELNVSVTNGNLHFGSELFPVPDDDLPKEDPDSGSVSFTGDNDSNYAELNLKNDGNIDAEFSVTITYDNEKFPEGKSVEDMISFDYLKVGIYNTIDNEWVNFGDDSNKVYYTTISALIPTEEGTNSYPVLRDVISSEENQNTKQYKVYVWLDENTPVTEIGKLIYLKLEVKSATVKGRSDKDSFKDPSKAAS